MKHILAIAFFYVTTSLFAQDLTIEWGEAKGSPGSLMEILPFHGKDFYTLRWQGGNAFGSYYLARFDDLKETKSKRISIAVNQNIADFEEALIVNDQPVTILTNIKNGKEQVFLQPYDYELKPKNNALLLAEYDLIRGMTKEPIKIIQSKDKKYFAVLWSLVAKRKEKDVYGYAVFNSKMKEIDRGEYEVPIISEFSQITDHILTNTGHYFFVLKEFEKNENRRYGQPDLIYKAMHIYQVSNDDGLTKYTMPVEGKRIEALSINTDDQSVFTITGVYGSNEFGGVNGVFFMQLNYQSQQIIRQGFQEFQKDFITEDWSDRALRKLERRIEQGKTEPAFYDYKMREAQILPDGSIIGLMEQNYVEVRTYSDMRSIVTYSYVYHYNDIVAFKIGENNSFEWIEKIKKSQSSMNDGGPYSSFASVIDNGQLKIIFNDHVNNYDKAGTYQIDQNNEVRFNLRQNVVALVSIDLASGLQTRKPMFSNKELNVLTAPKLFKIDYEEKKMLLFTTAKGKDRYGILTFK
jgi:hypothetical protein